MESVCDSVIFTGIRKSEFRKKLVSSQKPEKLEAPRHRPEMIATISHNPRPAHVFMYRILTVCGLMFLLLQAPGCAERHNDEMIHFGPNEKTDLVFVFKKDAPSKDIQHFLLRDGLVTPSNTSSGHDLPEGMDVGFAVMLGDFQGYGLNFKPSATDEQREAIKQRVKNSSLVYKIYENVKPSEIKDL